MLNTGTNSLGDSPVLIIGAGPGGLALAQGLRKRNIPYRIFDRDLDKKSRGQGWAVALQWVIPDLLDILPDDLPPIETISHLYNLELPSEGATFDAISGEEIARIGPHNLRGFVRADRRQLREWLSTGISIEWDKKLERFDERDSGVTAYFADGTTAQGCMLVGADGGISRVRNQLVGAENSELNILPMDVYIGNATMTKAQYEQHFKKFARSLWVAQSKRAYLFVGLHHVSPDAETAYYYWMVFRHHTEAEKEAEHSTARWSNERLYQAALEWTDHYDPKFLEIIHLSSPEGMVRVQSFMDTWYPPEKGFSSRRVTLLGDAAHKMTPFTGQGINHALQDCVDFIHVLGSGSESVPEVLKSYEKLVIGRGREAIRMTTDKALHW